MCNAGPTFLLATVFMLFCMGGNFAMFPAQTFRTFGAQVRYIAPDPSRRLFLARRKTIPLSWPPLARRPRSAHIWSLPLACVLWRAQGASVYSFLFTGFGCAALLGPLLSSALLQKGGYSLVYSVLALLSALSFTLCRLFL